ncbi:Uu.00g142160.m01.CDS01 [Anthostomella pinea]|uniref:Uu.00g142160.m01.CDS01 n=1 Tax=Anthostomella pinea TaxID=933095 RepID=A0AAI8VJY5_9PEZI|nr:Uu.00g142160.m01.CDS01 [Anthostomella pinea]
MDWDSRSWPSGQASDHDERVNGDDQSATGMKPTAEVDWVPGHDDTGCKACAPFDEFPKDLGMDHGYVFDTINHETEAVLDENMNDALCHKADSSAGAEYIYLPPVVRSRRDFFQEEKELQPRETIEFLSPMLGHVSDNRSWSERESMSLITRRLLGAYTTLGMLTEARKLTTIIRAPHLPSSLLWDYEQVENKINMGEVDTALVACQNLIKRLSDIDLDHLHKRISKRLIPLFGNIVRAVQVITSYRNQDAKDSWFMEGEEGTSTIPVDLDVYEYLAICHRVTGSRWRGDLRGAATIICRYLRTCKLSDAIPFDQDIQQNWESQITNAFLEDPNQNLVAASGHGIGVLHYLAICIPPKKDELADMLGKMESDPNSTAQVELEVNGFQHKTIITPLLLAVVAGNLVGVKLLITSGADHSAVDSHWRWNALDFAIAMNRATIVQYLVQGSYGFDVKGPLVNRGAHLFGQGPNGYGALHYAIESDHMPLVRHILAAEFPAGVDNWNDPCNYMNNAGETPAIFAVRKGNIEASRLLWDDDTDGEIYWTDNQSRNVLHAAAECNNYAILAFVMSRDEDENVIDTLNELNTVFHTAAMHASQKFFQHLSRLQFSPKKVARIKSRLNADGHSVDYLLNLRGLKFPC